jgi:hypothetical protein
MPKIIKRLTYSKFEWYANDELITKDDLPKKIIINNHKFKVEWFDWKWFNVKSNSVVIYYDGIIKETFTGFEIPLSKLDWVPIFAKFKPTEE